MSVRDMLFLEEESAITGDEDLYSNTSEVETLRQHAIQRFCYAEYTVPKLIKSQIRG